MDITVHGTDPFGNEAYRVLFENIMNDLGEALAIEKAEPREFRFHRPFLIYMKKRDADRPFFVMWVDNAELLVGQ